MVQLNDQILVAYIVKFDVQDFVLNLGIEQDVEFY